MNVARRLDVLRRVDDALRNRTGEFLEREPTPLTQWRPMRAVVAHRHEWFVGKLTEALREHGVHVVAVTDNGAQNGAGMYRTLRKLEGEGLVTSSWESAPTPGPARRNYGLTAAGRAELEVHVSQLKRSARQIRMFLRRHSALHDREQG